MRMDIMEKKLVPIVLSSAIWGLSFQNISQI